MSHSRMFTTDAPDDPAGKEPQRSPRTTIVGARPPEPPGTLPPIPTGMEHLLRLAAADPAFRRALVERRAEIAAAAGVALTPTGGLGAKPPTQPGVATPFQVATPSSPCPASSPSPAQLTHLRRALGGMGGRSPPS